MDHVLITGASRGLGFEFTRQYLQRGAKVFAGYRQLKTAGKLQELKKSHSDRLILVPLDVSDEESILQACGFIGESTDQLSVLINNAGIGGFDSRTGKQEQLGTFHMDDACVVLRTMALGPLLLAQECMGLMKAAGSAKIINITSGYGSVSSNTHKFPYYYSAAKSALHQLMRSLAEDVRPLGISVTLLDPGSVSTDMGGPTAPLTPTQSVSGMMQVIDGLTLERSNSFISWQGKLMPW
jgi:NAD(P)-dependent dehydrogenase (short-subunit alcohol dehydrogenase family)